MSKLRNYILNNRLVEVSEHTKRRIELCINNGVKLTNSDQFLKGI